MANKSIETQVKDGTTKRTSVSSIERTLRNSVLAVATAGVVMSAPTVKAQLSTNTVDLGPMSSLSLRWSPQDSPQVVSSPGRSQNYSAFNPSLGTLDSVTLSFTLNYSIDDHAQATANYAAQDVTALSPFLTIGSDPTLFSLSTATGVGPVGSGSISQPYSIFSYNITSTSIDPVQSGTLTYSLLFDTPSQLDAFLNSGSIAYNLADASTPSPDAPYQMLQDNTGSALSTINLNENFVGDPTLTEVYSTPEPSTIALGALGAASLLLLRRRKN
jgi:hypothetical protein